MSDRGSTQKKFNEIFIQYRNEIMPTVLENWDNLEAVDKQSLLNVNEFFCGLHYMVALAEQAEATLKLADNLLYGTSEVGSPAHGGYTKGESGTTQLIRTVCKSVQE